MKKMDNFSDPIGYLQQLCSKIGWLLPVYKDLGQSKSSSSSGEKLVFRTDCTLNDIFVIGESNAKKDSKKNAATKMIKALNDHYRSTITVYNLQSGIPGNFHIDHFILFLRKFFNFLFLFFSFF